MKPRRQLWWCAVALLLPAASAVAQYSVHRLVGAVYGYGGSLASNGLAATNLDGHQAAIEDGRVGTVQSLYTPLGGGLDYNYTFGINDLGQAVGYVNDLAGTRAVIFTGGTVHDLGYLPGGINSFAQGINSSGQAVGYGSNASGSYEAFLYSGGEMHGLGFLAGGSSSFAFGINATGQVAGSSSTASGSYEAFVSTGTGLLGLGYLTGGSISFAQSINASGQVVGYGGNASGGREAFLYSGGVMRGLGVLAGGTNSYAQGINAAGQVVGLSEGASRRPQAFLYSGGAMTSLNALVGGYDFGNAHAINDRGDILVSATCAVDGSWCGSALVAYEGPTSAVPEPASLALVATGLLGVGLVARRRRITASTSVFTHQQAKPPMSAPRLRLALVAALRTAVFCAALPVLALRADAQLVSTFGAGDSFNPDAGWIVYSGPQAPGYHLPTLIAQHFVNDGPDAALTRIRLAVFRANGYEAKLWEGADLNTATLRESWHFDALGAVYGDIYSLYSTGTRLAAGRDYWLSLENPIQVTTGFSAWNLNDQGILGFAISMPAGVSGGSSPTGWINLPDPSIACGRGCFSAAYDVSVSTVPEPASLALLATGLLGVGLVARRRTRQ